jgi:adenine/guanine phosphoribosyltransferase-like PRPP-binding protein
LKLIVDGIEGKKMRMNSDYLGKFLQGKKLQATIDKVCRIVYKHFPECRSIAFRGISGALVAPAVAAKLKLRLVAVRKGKSNCHSYNVVEGPKNCGKYVIIDDFIYSGFTIHIIVRRVEQHFCGECIGVITYAGGDTRDNVEEIESKLGIPVVSAFKKNDPRS